MRSTIKFLLFAWVLLGLAACQKTMKPEELPASVKLQKTYYSQVGLHYEKGRHRTTNYGVGIFLPLNTAVKPIEMGRKKFVVEVVDTRERLEFVNHPKHTQDSIVQAFEKLFGDQQIELFKFNALERKNISSGTVAKGMSKAAVIVARGYPPAIETPTLERDQWKYWNSRWDTIIVTFKNDRVSNIKD